MSKNGEGIGHADGYTLFIKNAVIGDIVEAEVTLAKKNYGFARTVKVIKSSEDRVLPKCKKARECGGCTLQSLSYPAQLSWKQSTVENSLKRIGGFSVPVEPIVGMDDPWRYRNKSQYPVGRAPDGSVVTGFYAAGTHDIISNEDCLLSPENDAEILSAVRSFMERFKIAPYDERSGQGLVRHVLIRRGFFSGEIMVCLVVNGRSLPHAADLVGTLTKMPGMTSVCLNVNMKNDNVILGSEVLPLFGAPYITDKIGELTFRISPLSFYQVNPIQTKKLYDAVKEFAALSGKENVLDLYCGVGTIGLYLAAEAKSVTGIEIEPAAVEDAGINAKINGIQNASFSVGAAEDLEEGSGAGDKAEDKSEDKAENKAENKSEDKAENKSEDKAENKSEDKAGDKAEKGLQPDLVVLDPPRKGCDEKLLATVLRMSPEKIVYVSCNPATLARDLKLLCAEAYELKKVRPHDLFPMTCHVESVVLMTRK